ncbi:MAG: tRNA pseudouridine(55) synthase TruB [Elusimicrobia bacterium]|nr:tRNA pseudouridine(55) synthase TruB [Elusimicrobiota bacterium]
MKKTEQDISGIFLFDKPSQTTSHGAVKLFREKLNIKRIGHGGTLDPMATGLLVLFVGLATKSQSKVQNCNKVYTGNIELGIETDTWDGEGRILKECKVGDFTPASLKRIIAFMTGKIAQNVPPFSAVKYKGKRLYKLARRNMAVPAIKRQVNVKWLKYSYKKPFLHFKIECSSGTYIRSIAHEMGIKLGCGGCLSKLRRESIASWSVNDAVDLDFLKKSSYEQVISKIRDVPSDLEYR